MYKSGSAYRLTPTISYSGFATMTNPLDSLISMTRALGEPARDYVIIGEGNTSMRIDDESFYVKASGHQMRNIDESGFVALRIAPILALLEAPPASLREEKAIAQAAVIGAAAEGAPRPSVEVSFHAMLLHECEVPYIGHTHPTAINQIMCSEHAADFAHQRRFPDEAVLCGPRSALTPYADPGLPLALVMRERVRAYLDAYGEAPKLILLENHGMIALGGSPAEILNITAMAVKAARIFLGALLTGKPTSLPEDEIWHVYRRPDEIYRRRLFVEDKPNS